MQIMMLFVDLYEKIEDAKAMENIRKADGFTVIFDSSKGLVDTTTITPHDLSHATSHFDKFAVVSFG
jgi:hypothetical protein